MSEYFDSDLMHSVSSELVQTAHELSGFVQAHTLLTAVALVTAVLLWRWAATPSH